MDRELALKLVLRLIGTSSLTALIFVAAPYAWMNSIHAALGMGTLPDAPVVGYLTRSLSAFYALMGGMFWVLSFDLPRYRTLLGYIGAAVAVFGVVLFVVDFAEGLPALWRFWEGPFVVAMGLAIFFLSRGLRETR